ncbi:unnamed protein product, partial [Timema podura]|nr:unnamed protein product [Timema podura]
VHRSSLDKYSLSIPGNPQRTISLLLAKQRSFDVAESETGQDNRFPSSQPPSLGAPLARSYSFMQRQDRYHDYQCLMLWNIITRQNIFTSPNRDEEGMDLVIASILCLLLLEEEAANKR